MKHSTVYQACNLVKIYSDLKSNSCLDITTDSTDCNLSTDFRFGGVNDLCLGDLAELCCEGEVVLDDL